MSRVLPILFNTDMVRAILDGRKTVTRRCVKDNVVDILNSPYHKEHPEVSDEVLIEKLCNAPYNPGDILYVRETWTRLYYVDPEGYTHYDQDMYFFAADGVPDIALCDADGFQEDDQRIRWRPSIHMPKEIARLWIKVTDVRAEQLQNIRSEDLRKEGMLINFIPSEVKSPFNKFGVIGDIEEKKEGFYRLWNSTLKKADLDRYGWETNPWVWVIEFERCEKPEEN